MAKASTAILDQGGKAVIWKESQAPDAYRTLMVVL